MEEIKPGVYAEKASSDSLFLSKVELKVLAEEWRLPDVLSIEQIAFLLDKDFHDFLDEVVKRSLRMAHDSNLAVVIERSEYKRYLQKIKKWPLPEDCLLSNWWSDYTGMETISLGSKTKLEKQLEEPVNKPKTPTYSQREQDFDNWREAAQIDLDALTVKDIHEQVKLWSKNKKLWSIQITTFRRDFWQEYSRKRELVKESGRRAKQM